MSQGAGGGGGAIKFTLPTPQSIRMALGLPAVLAPTLLTIHDLIARMNMNGVRDPHIRLHATAELVNKLSTIGWLIPLGKVVEGQVFDWGLGFNGIGEVGLMDAYGVPVRYKVPYDTECIELVTALRTPVNGKDPHYPHTCPNPKCGGPAYVGFQTVECKRGCK